MKKTSVEKVKLILMDGCEEVKNPMFLSEVEQDIYKVDNVEDMKAIRENKNLLMEYGIHISDCHDYLLILFHKYSSHSMVQRKFLVENIKNKELIDDYYKFNQYISISFTTVYGKDLFNDKLTFNKEDLYNGHVAKFLHVAYSLKRVKDYNSKFPVYEIVTSAGEKEIVNVFINNTPLSKNLGELFLKQ